MRNKSRRPRESEHTLIGGGEGCWGFADSDGQSYEDEGDEVNTEGVSRGAADRGYHYGPGEEIWTRSRGGGRSRGRGRGGVVGRGGGRGARRRRVDEEESVLNGHAMEDGRGPRNKRRKGERGQGFDSCQLLALFAVTFPFFLVMFFAALQLVEALQAAVPRLDVPSSQCFTVQDGACAGQCCLGGECLWINNDTASDMQARLAVSLFPCTSPRKCFYTFL